ncbi:uncharacterized protein MKZ38_000949 [Zalerion maritima]|uniref:LysM domain-containing protein n=1 Tax=Zalerion maritima TaxID=339359 RepID=A0AAD5RFK0_9PEZI|nr:uncharacterized protein MKZ38_000949 [Zalerion maritima]
MAPLTSFLLWLLVTPFIDGQQFADFTFLWDAFDLSDSCFDAVNTTIRCPQILVPHSETIPLVNFLDQNSFTELCTPPCEYDLRVLRGDISASCSKNDTMTYQRNEYPATYMVDRFLYVYNITCYRDGFEFCNTKLQGERDYLTSWELEEDCSNCNLGIWQKQAESPFGFQEERVSSLSSLASFCSRSGFEVASPTLDYALALGAETTSTALTTSTMLFVSMTTDVEVATETIPAQYAECPIKYTIEEGDTCDSICEGRGVDTYSILALNGFNYCPMLPFVGSNICIPLPCEVYRIHDFDTCDFIAMKNNVNVEDLVGWNDVLGHNCRNIRSLHGWYICVSRPQRPFSMTAHFQTMAETSTGSEAMVGTSESKTSSSSAEVTSDGLVVPMTTETLTVVHGTHTTTMSTIKATISTFVWTTNTATLNWTLEASNSLPSTVLPSYVDVDTTTATDAVPNFTSIATATEAEPMPTNAMPMSVLECAEWYTARAQDTCEGLSQMFGISVVDLKFLNPELEYSCPKLMTGWAYCVEAAGDIASSPGYSSYTMAATSIGFDSSANFSNTGQSAMGTTTAATSFAISTPISIPTSTLKTTILSTASSSEVAVPSHTTTTAAEVPSSAPVTSPKSTFTNTTTETSTVYVTRPNTTLSIPPDTLGSPLDTPTSPIVFEPLPFPTGTHGIPPPDVNETGEILANNPLAPGTWDNCAEYKDGVSMTEVYEMLDEFGWDYGILGDLAANLDSCSFVARSHRTTYPDFLTWNPSLTAHHCLLDVNYSYCSRLLPATDADLEFCDDLNQHAGAVVPKGTHENCDCYAVIYGADASYYTCDRIQVQFGISNPALLAMNPWIGTADCTNAMYSNLGDIEPRAVCVGAPVPVSPNPDTGVGVNQVLRRSKATGKSAVNARTRLLARRVRDQQQYRGESVSHVERHAGGVEKRRAPDIQIDMTAKSNDAVAYVAVAGRKDYANMSKKPHRKGSPDNKNQPRVGSEDTVARPGRSKMLRRDPEPPNAPVHPGTGIEGCVFWHTVLPHDDCRSISAQYGVEDVAFLWWNWGVGKDCDYLQPGYAVCVGHKHF